MNKSLNADNISNNMLL
jgi:ribosomal protein S1